MSLLINLCVIQDRESGVIDFVVTFELYACELGHSYVLLRYGPQGYIFAIVAIGLLQAAVIFLPSLWPGPDGAVYAVFDTYLTQFKQRDQSRVYF